VLSSLAAHGLARQPDLQIVMMCEIPNNVILMDEFAALFDGFSIGSNDLTQLTLGVDRDSTLVAEAFDERDPGMLKMYQWAIEGAHRHGRTIGICGQAPSDHPDLAAQLVAMGIDSMSLSADRLLATWQQLAALEQAALEQASVAAPAPIPQAPVRPLPGSPAYARAP
jgi:pyruvate,water dikinase